MEIIDDDKKKEDVTEKVEQKPEEKIKKEETSRKISKRRDNINYGSLFTIILIVFIIAYVAMSPNIINLILLDPPIISPVQPVIKNDTPENPREVKIQFMRKYALVFNVNKNLCPDLAISYNNVTLPVEEVKGFDISFVDLGYHSEEEEANITILNQETCKPDTTILARIMLFNDFVQVLMDAGVPMNENKNITKTL